MTELSNLIDQAEREGKWLFSRYQQLWFSPQELRDANAQGRFRWGPVNWELRDPQELIETAKRDVTTAERRQSEIEARIKTDAH